MSWNQYLYQYHKKYGGQFLAGEIDDGLLVLPFNDRPLVVTLSHAGVGRGRSVHYVQARIPVTLAKPYKLTIGAEKALSGGVNAVLRAVPSLPGGNLLPADFGFPEVTKKRLIRSDNYDFTKLVLGSLDFRNALLACPGERVEVRSGPGEDGLHLITVITDAAIDGAMFDGGGGDWYLGNGEDYMTFYGSEEEREQEARRVEEKFFPRLEHFLDLTRAVYHAVTQWPM